MSSYEKFKRKLGWNLFIVSLLGSAFLLFFVEDIARWRMNDLELQEKERFVDIRNSSARSNVSEPDPSCLSRTQLEFFRKSAHLPPVLSAALGEYEKMHARCSRGRNLSDIISKPDPGDDCKYIVFLQDGKFGLGNHILSLVSAFVYALLTKRMLLVDARGHLPGLFCEPFRNSSWLLPPEFPYQHLLQAPFLDDQLEQKLKYVNAFHLMLLSEQTEGEKQFFCPQTQVLLQNVTWIGWSCNQYYVPRFFTFPQFWRPMVALFPDVSMIFTQLSKYLVLPQNHVWQKIVSFQLSYLSTPGKKLGLQIRMRGDRASFDVPTLERVMQCVIGNSLLPNISDPGNMNGIKHLEENVHNHRLQNTTTVLITSLQGRFYEELKKSYADNGTVDGSLVQFHTLSHDEAESSSYDQAVNALAEMWLLSFSDVLVTSSWSTFGYVAQGLAGIRPYILNIKGDFEKDRLPPCSLGQSVEPCNQYPFRNVCKLNDTEKSEHVNWIKRHVRSCQDEPDGIQLTQP